MEYTQRRTGKIEPKEIDQLPVPFIAYTRYREHHFVVVNNVSDDTINVFTENYKKTTSFKREDFLKNWNGTYLIAEPNEHSGEKNYQQNKFNYFVLQLIPTLAVVLSAVLSFLFIRTASPAPSE